MNIQFNITIDDKFVSKLKKFFSPRNSALLTVACMVFAGIIIVSAASLNGELKIFNPGDPVVAEEVNHNFALLEDGVHNMVPPGSIMPFAGDTLTPPEGWFFCDGSEKSKTKYPRLYTAIKNTWGGSVNSDTFLLPDFRGVFLRGYDKRKKEDGNRDIDASIRIGIGGVIGNFLGAFQDDAFQGHQHKYGQLSRVQLGNDNGYGLDAENLEQIVTKNYDTDGLYGKPRMSSESRPKNITVNYIIKY